MGRTAALVTILFAVIALVALAGTAAAQECWQYNNDKTGCLDNSNECRWDIYGKFCVDLGCWDFREESTCADAANATYNMSCSWKESGGSSGWCEDSTACWNFREEPGCTGAGCAWDGTAYCQEVSCWNYDSSEECNSRAGSGCEWDGWNCVETSGCWGSYSEVACDGVSGCQWQSNAWCAQTSCWNFADNASCTNSSLGCVWSVNEWMEGGQGGGMGSGGGGSGGFCEDAMNCYSITTQQTCEAADCKWDGQWNSCMEAGCWNYFDDVNCTAATVGGANCAWNADWSYCYEPGCWDYLNDTACAGAGCTWNAQYSYCKEGGCWDAGTAGECSGLGAGCTWMSSSGWCEEENCWSLTNASCSGSALGCQWQEGEWGGYCSQLGCWNNNNSVNCTAGSENGVGCAWNADWSYCYRPGCWNAVDNASCTSGSNCEWVDSGQCKEQGCWDYANTTSCTTGPGAAAGCQWGNSGWCEDPGCWNNKDQTDCGADASCTWNEQWGYCQELDCYSLTYQSICDQHAADLSCQWDNWSQSCVKQGCWNYNNGGNCTEAPGALGCTWQANGLCNTRSCWNYKTNTSCLNDTDTSDCGWSGYCTGDYTKACWQYAAEGDCAGAAGCTWQGNCYELGCSANSDSGACTATNSTCGWQASGYCKETGCWDYYNTGNCTAAAGCLWESTWNYCYEQGCWSYANSTSCNQNSQRDCAWDSQGNYCYEEGCWNYPSQAQCAAYNSSACVWSDIGQYCYKEGCWAQDDSATCDAQSECDWVDSGWCYDKGCWNYGTSADCALDSSCAWNADWSYCYEKGCQEYTIDVNCTAVAKCKWDGIGGYCYEQGCWNNYAEGDCAGDPTCFWDASYGWCNQGGCWDYANGTDCTGDADNVGPCLWDPTWNYCYEQGCWANPDEGGCTANSSSSPGLNCTWNTGQGWCYKQGCWDYRDNSSCLGDASCDWNEEWDYCYEKGCWDNANDTDCAGAGCAWKQPTWGWCEQLDCWSFSSTNESACENNTNSLDCVWNAPDCERAACWAFDSNEFDCTNVSGAAYVDHSLNCTYEDGRWCEPAQGACSQYDGNQKGCMDTSYCFYNWQSQECREPADSGGQGFVEDAVLFNPTCWLFDQDDDACWNVTFCGYNASALACENTPGNEELAIQCENITDMGLCNSLPSLASCCRWRDGECRTQFDEEGCHENIEEPPEGAAYCEDFNSYANKQLCDQIAGSPWYMPCAWDGEHCTFRFDDAAGGGDYLDIKSKQLCLKAAGEWVCEDYCDGNSSVSTDDDILKAECWCQAGTGKSNCKKSCWACESNESMPWPTLGVAQSACESSPAGCEFEQDAGADNGFGYCDYGASVESGGGCDSVCSACGDIADDPATSAPETKLACIQSEAGCTWAANLANASIGQCLDKSDKTCSESCFACSKDECEGFGLGTAGKCDWDSTDALCAPAGFDKEVCFNGKDDDNDEGVDCDDMDCYFSPECGEGTAMNDCWQYQNQGNCTVAPLLGDNGRNCSWIADQWGGAWCGHPSEKCWQFDATPAACDSQQGACTYKNEKGKCDLNKTAADSCKNKLKGACTGDCAWTADPTNPKGGSCDAKMFVLCHDPDIDTQQECESTANLAYCGWRKDINSPSGGWCEPKCFSMDDQSCAASPKCQWVAGWCKPNITTSSDCYTYDGDQSGCQSQLACAWSVPQFGGACEPNEDLLEPCWDNYFDSASCIASSNCTWVVDRFAGAGGSGFCEHKTFACWKNDFTDLPTCEAVAGCVWDGLSSRCEQGCHALTPADCAADTSCVLKTGFCDPKGKSVMFQGMDAAPPTVVGVDDCPEAGLSDVQKADICGLGVKDDKEVFGIGTEMVSLSLVGACNGEWIMDKSTWPPTATQGTGTEPLKAEFYIGSDGILTGGCSASNNAQTGLEFKVVLDTTLAAKEKVTMYQCINGAWSSSSSVQASTMAKVMCGMAGGPVVMLDKAGLLATGLFDPSHDMRIYAITVNSTTDAPFDAVFGIYTPGTVGFMKENCMGFTDADGDGLKPDQDPDCKFAKQFGGALFEDCHNVVDDDKDGLVDCADPQCAFMPSCGGSILDFTASANDTTMPSVTSYKVDEFVDAAFVRYDTDEPANGTLKFYRNDSTCSSLNATVHDVGILDANVPNYKMWHDGPIKQQTIGYALDAATTYYYKLVVCDKAQNPCAESACLSFTTEASMDSCGITCQPVFDIQYAGSEGDANLEDAEVQWDFGQGFQPKGCGGKAAVKMNYSDTENVSVLIINENATDPWSLGFGGMDIMGDIDSNKTSLDEDDIYANQTEEGIEYVGMDHDKWEDIKDELMPEYIDICVPGYATVLYYCASPYVVSVDDCTDVTNLTLSGPVYNATMDCTEFRIPADLGFSVYFGYAAASLPGGGGGGGGGGSSGSSGGGGAPTVSNSTSKRWTTMEAGKEQVMKVYNAAFGLSQLSFEVTETLSNVEIKVTRLGDRPAEAASEAGTAAYRYLDIDRSILDEGRLRQVKFRFHVEKSWLEAQGGSTADVRLFRFAGSQWNELPTVYTDSDDAYAYFNATSPGMSYFAIALTKAGQPGAQAPEEEAPTPAGEKLTGATVSPPAEGGEEGAPEAGGEGKGNSLAVALLIALLVALAIAGGGYLYWKRQPPQRPAAKQSEGQPAKKQAP